VEPLHITLADGGTATVRPIEPTDREALLSGFLRLSDESRYRRFFSPMPTLSNRDLDYLVNVDHHHHEALVALDPDDGHIVGVTRFVRTGPGEAEPAIVVADDWQGRGLGRRLLDELADRAREEGVERFRAPVLAENDAALRLLGGIGEHWTRHDGNEVEIAIELAPPPAAGSVFTRLLRVAAEGGVSPAVTLLDRLGLRARYGPPDRAEQANTLVVAVEPGTSDGAALRVAAELAPVLGASVQLVSARRLPVLGRERDADAALETAASALRDRGVTVDVHRRAADAVTALVSVAAERRARMVIVGAQRSDAPRVLPGDVPGAVARQAPCDVLIAR
jgi:GNAT superfamily N-acetyltransferase